MDVAIYFGVSDLIIGLTMAAVGTSLPELASCISAIRRHHTDLLVGNIIGSNLFNLLMVFGGTGIVYPFAIPADLLKRDVPVMICFPWCCSFPSSPNTRSPVLPASYFC